MNIAVIDDLSLDREKTAVCLQTYFKQCDKARGPSIFEFESGEAFLSAFKPGKFDIVMIDIYMNGISGLDTARKIRCCDWKAVLIFITYSRDYAVEGYTVKASGYLLKPFSYESLAKTMDQIDLQLLDENKFIEIETKRGTVSIILHDIIHCNIEGHYVQLHTGSLGIQRSRMTFLAIAALLKPYKEFLPCYRGCIINMDHVRKIETYNFYMDNESRIPFRVKEQSKLAKAYADYLFWKVRSGR